MKISTISIGFLEVPSQISLNIYVQGCKKRCKNCHNPELQSFQGGEEITLIDFKKIIKRHELPTWVCWVGGDAVYQPDDFKHFSKASQIIGLKNCLYTGLKFEELFDKTDLLNNIDLVIDGEYIEEQGTVDKDTTNQRCFLKEKIKNITGCWNQYKFKDLKTKLLKYK